MLAADLERERAGAARVSELDVRDAAAVARQIAAAHAAMGGLDTLVKAAAIDTGWPPAANMALGTWDATIATSLSGTYYAYRAAAPGVIDGGLTDTVTDPADRERLVAMHPVGRMGSVAEAAVWPASDASAFTTGSTLGVDGGFLA